MIVHYNHKLVLCTCPSHDHMYRVQQGNVLEKLEKQLLIEKEKREIATLELSPLLTPLFLEHAKGYSTLSKGLFGLKNAFTLQDSTVESVQGTVELQTNAIHKRSRI